MFQPQSRGSSAHAHTLPPLHPPLDDDLPLRVREHLQRLKSIIPVISVSILALRAQGAELDEDIASVLSLHACAPLDEEVEDLESLVECIAAQRAERRVAA